MTGTTNDNDNRRLIALILMWGVILTIVFCSLAGCKTTEYIEVPEVHTEYVYRDRVDTSYVKDSVYIREQTKGDTVKVVEYRYRDRYREIWRTDTIIQQDTISVVHTQVVEKTVAKMNSLQSAFFWLGLLAFFIVIGYVAYRLLLKKFSFH
jgi:hypothetical protein